MLQRAAAADAEMRAARLNPIWRGRQHTLESTLIEVAAAPETHPFDALARKGVVDEDGLARRTSDAAPIVRQIRDIGDFSAPVRSC